MSHRPLIDEHLHDRDAHTIQVDCYFTPNDPLAPCISFVYAYYYDRWLELIDIINQDGRSLKDILPPEAVSALTTYYIDLFDPEHEIGRAHV